MKLENGRHSRIRGGVLSIHSNETVQFQRTHGAWIFTRFEDSLFEYALPMCHSSLALWKSITDSSSPRNLDQALKQPPWAVTTRTYQTTLTV